MQIFPFVFIRKQFSVKLGSTIITKLEYQRRIKFKIPTKDMEHFRSHFEQHTHTSPRTPFDISPRYMFDSSPSCIYHFKLFTLKHFELVGQVYHARPRPPSPRTTKLPKPHSNILITRLKED